jgi:ABC-2 type transport system permease protein
MALTTTGWVFTAVTAVAAQVMLTTGATYGVTGGVIGVTFFLRGVGDAGAGALSWLSPIGWGQATRPYADERWWPLALPVATTAVLLGLAMWLHGRRDHGAAVWSTRAPRDTDEELHPWGLVWRLQRGTVVGWSTALFLLGLGYGALAESADGIVGDTDFAKQVFAGGTTPSHGFLGTVVLLLALLAAAAGVMVTSRPDAEERSGRLDHLLAGPLSRLRWSLQHTIVALVAVVSALAAAGLGTGLGHALTVQDGGAVLPPVAAALSYLPAVLVVTALARLAHGLSGSPAAVGWGVLAWCAFVGMFAGLMDLPRLLTGLSPFDHVATMPVENFSAAPWAVLWAVALAIGVTAQCLLVRRDLK